VVTARQVVASMGLPDVVAASAAGGVEAERDDMEEARPWVGEEELYQRRGGCHGGRCRGGA
jgi:hypothetical protein